MDRVLMIMVAAGSFTACDPDSVVLGPKDGCDVGAMRCNDQAVEICGSDERWVVAQDCREVEELSGGRWACDETGEDGPHCAPLDLDAGPDSDGDADEDGGDNG